MRPPPVRRLWVCGLLLVSLGCRSRETPSDPRDGAIEGPPADVTGELPRADAGSADASGGPPDVSAPADAGAERSADAPAADTAARTPCGTSTCDATTEICVITNVAGGLPGSGVSTSHACRPRPGSCPAEPDCACTRSYCLAVACSCRTPPMTAQTIQCDCAAP